MSDMLPQIAAQLFGQAPTLVAYAAGALLALVFWNRCPVPSLLTLIASLLLLATALGVSLLSAYMLSMDVSLASRGTYLTIVSLGSGFVRMGAMGLLFTAIFHGRLKKPAAAA